MKSSKKNNRTRIQKENYTAAQPGRCFCEYKNLTMNLRLISFVFALVVSILFSAFDLAQAEDDQRVFEWSKDRAGDRYSDYFYAHRQEFHAFL
jgi:hypothetical protein